MLPFIAVHRPSLSHRYPNQNFSPGPPTPTRPHPSPSTTNWAWQGAMQGEQRVAPRAGWLPANAPPVQTPDTRLKASRQASDSSSSFRRRRVRAMDVPQRHQVGKQVRTTGVGARFHARCGYWQLFSSPLKPVTCPTCPDGRDARRSWAGDGPQPGYGDGGPTMPSLPPMPGSAYGVPPGPGHQTSARPGMRGILGVGAMSF